MKSHYTFNTFILHTFNYFRQKRYFSLLRTHITKKIGFHTKLRVLLVVTVIPTITIMMQE